METYDAMRHFADSWGLVGMMVFFLCAVALTLLPGAKARAAEAAAIPLKDDPKPDCCRTCTGDGPCARITNLFEESAP